MQQFMGEIRDIMMQTLLYGMQLYYIFYKLN